MEKMMSIRNWFRTEESTKQSEFFKGSNIVDTMNQSSFGNIRETMVELFGKEPGEDYSLPTVVVIGEESVGKSSLLEKIIKAQIFPRDTKICTKCPIHLKLDSSEKQYISISYKDTTEQLDSKNDIYERVRDIFKTFPENNISSDEIEIKICEPNMPTFEFYDLPGIVSYPKNNANTTVKLCKKYLSNDNTIVLCVVPATITRLTSCTSIGLLREMNMEKNAVIAFTMIDRVQHINIPDLVLKRLLGDSDELKHINVAGCVAIINRTHDDKYSLEESDTKEMEWFSANILDNIPDESIKNKISSNINTDNLIKRLDELYSQYIEKEWKPKIKTKITQKKKKLETELTQMGIEINTTNSEKIIKYVVDAVYDIYNYQMYNTMYYSHKNNKCNDSDNRTTTQKPLRGDRVKSKKKKICKESSDDDSDEWRTNITCKSNKSSIKESSDEEDVKLSENKKSELKTLLQTHNTIKKNHITCEECKDNILNSIIENVNNYFSEDVSEYSLARFSDLPEFLTDCIKHNINEKFADTRGEIEKTVNIYINTFLLNCDTRDINLKTVNLKIANIILGEVFYTQSLNIIEILNVNLENFAFNENDEYQNKRAALAEDIDRLKVHMDKISAI